MLVQAASTTFINKPENILTLRLLLAFATWRVLSACAQGAHGSTTCLSVCGRLFIAQVLLVEMTRSAASRFERGLAACPVTQPTLARARTGAATLQPGLGAFVVLLKHTSSSRDMPNTQRDEAASYPHCA